MYTGLLFHRSVLELPLPPRTKNWDSYYLERNIVRVQTSKFILKWKNYENKSSYLNAFLPEPPPISIAASTSSTTLPPISL
mmetsp:Transcript_41106/g.80454  ORF Transcript_41106/g.80454 Transcript_41106/m.80454 type:complete len:81 (+) Transcript_41106:27-269(+)